MLGHVFFKARTKHKAHIGGSRSTPYVRLKNNKNQNIKIAHPEDFYQYFLYTLNKGSNPVIPTV